MIESTVCMKESQEMGNVSLDWIQTADKLVYHVGCKIIA
jgi:hypothetical protein